MAFNTEKKIRTPEIPFPVKPAADHFIGLDKLLFDILIKLNKVSMNDLYNGLEGALKLAVDYLDVDRGVLSEFLDNKSEHKVMLIYNRPGVHKIHLSELGRTIPDFSRRIKSGRVTYFPPATRIPQEWGPERKYIQNTGLKAHIGLPIEVGDEIVGCLIFATFREGREWPRDLREKLKLLAEIFSNALSRKKAHIKVRESLKLQELISSISTRFLNLPPIQVNQELAIAMKEITEYFDIDRLSLFMSQNFARGEAFRLTHFWSRYEDEMDKKREEFKSFDFPYISKKIMKEGHFAFSKLDDFPENAWIDRQNIIRARTKSTLAIPLIFSNNTEGVLSFDTLSREKKWTPRMISEAKIIAQIFTNVLSRQKADLHLRNAYEEIQRLKVKLEKENILLRKEIELQHAHEAFLGRSKAVMNVLEQVEKVAAMDTSVLVLGETGTGKDLLAHEIHRLSLRKDKTMIRVNCASLPASLVENELFGHEKGAFTGAVSTQLGRFEVADGGTVFLDEIGEMPLEVQAKLLRVLQDSCFERLGSTKTISVNVRVIAATNRNLSEEIKKGKFRQDLYYRLSVFPIFIPPLRERGEDIRILAFKFVEEFSKSMGKEIKKIPQKTIDLLQNYSWPGNVRELRNVIEHSMILSSGSELNIKLPPEAGGETPLRASLEEIERRHILNVLNSTRWHVKGKNGAADILKMNPSTLYSRMKKLGIDPSNFKQC